MAGRQEVQEGLEGCIALENPIEVGDLVDAKAGVLGRRGTSWNTRFGLYKGGAGNPGPEDGAMPDTTGYAYTIVNWTLGRDAFDDYHANRTATSLTEPRRSRATDYRPERQQLVSAEHATEHAAGKGTGG